MRLVLIRHGETDWNRDNKFCGWTDIDIDDTGVKEAHTAGVVLRETGAHFDIAFTSVLKRAEHTLQIVLAELGATNLPIERTWRLNERHYGALQGLNKVEMAQKFGDEQVLLWRRSYDIRPPALTKDDPRYPGNDQKYKDLKETELPLTECLKDTVERFMPYWHAEIAPTIRAGKQVLIVAHGNSLRALVKYLDNMSDKDIISYNMPTGVPLVYELDAELKPLSKRFLGDEAAIAERIAKATKRP